MSAEKRVTCSAIKPLIEVVEDKIMITEDNDTELTFEIKQRIKNDLKINIKVLRWTSCWPRVHFLILDLKIDLRTKEDNTVMILMDKIKILSETERASECRAIARRSFTTTKENRVQYLVLVHWVQPVLQELIRMMGV